MTSGSTPCLNCVVKEKEHNQVIQILDQRYQHLKSKIALSSDIIQKYNSFHEETARLREELRGVKEIGRRTSDILRNRFSKQHNLEKEVQRLRNEVQRYKTLYENEQMERNGCSELNKQLNGLLDQQAKDLENKDEKIARVELEFNESKRALSIVKKKYVNNLRDTVACVSYVIRNGADATHKRILSKMQKELRSLDKSEFSEDEGIFSPDVSNSFSSKEGIFSPNIFNSSSRDEFFAEDCSSMDSNIHSKEQRVSEILDNKSIAPEPTKKSDKKLKELHTKSLFEIDADNNSQKLNENNSVKKIKEPQTQSMFDIDADNKSKKLTNNNAVTKLNEPPQTKSIFDIDEDNESKILTENHAVNKTKEPQTKSLFVIDADRENQILTPSKTILKHTVEPKNPLKLMKSSDVSLKSSNTIHVNPSSVLIPNVADKLEVPSARSHNVLHQDTAKNDKIETNVMQTSTTTSNSLYDFTLDCNIEVKDIATHTSKERTVDPKNNVDLLPEDETSGLSACNTPINLNEEPDVDQILAAMIDHLPLLSPMSPCTATGLQSSSEEEIKKVPVSKLASVKLQDVGINTDNFLGCSHAAVQTTNLCSQEKKKILTCSVAVTAHPNVHNVGVETVNNTTCEKASQTIDITPVRTCENASQTDCIKPFTTCENMSQTDDIKRVISCDNGSQTNDIQPVLTFENVLQADDVKPLITNGFPFQHIPVQCLCCHNEMHGNSMSMNRALVSNFQLPEFQNHQVSRNDIASQKVKIITEYMKRKSFLTEQWKYIDDCIFKLLNFPSENCMTREHVPDVAASTSKCGVSNCGSRCGFQENENREREEDGKAEKRKSDEIESHNMPKKSTSKPDRNPFYSRPSENVVTHPVIESAHTVLPNQDSPLTLPVVPSTTHVDTNNTIEPVTSNHLHLLVTPEQTDSINLQTIQISKCPKNVDVPPVTETDVSVLHIRDKSLTLPVIPTSTHVDTNKITKPVPSNHPHSPIIPVPTDNINQVEKQSTNATETQICSDYSTSTPNSCVNSSHVYVKGTEHDSTGSSLEYSIDQDENERTSDKLTSKCHELENGHSSGNEYQKSVDSELPLVELTIPNGDISSKIVPLNRNINMVDLFGSESESDSSSDKCVNLNKRKLDEHNSSKVSKQRKISIFDKESNDTTSEILSCSKEISRQKSSHETKQNISEGKCPGTSFATHKLSKLQKMKRAFIKAKLPSKIEMNISEKLTERKKKNRTDDMHRKSKIKISRECKGKFSADTSSANEKKVDVKSSVPAKGSVPVCDSKEPNECSDSDGLNCISISESVNNEIEVKSPCSERPSTSETSGVNQYNSATVLPVEHRSSIPLSSPLKKRNFVAPLSSSSLSSDLVKVPDALHQKIKHSKMKMKSLGPQMKKNLRSDIDKIEPVNDKPPLEVPVLKTDRTLITYADLFEPVVDAISPIKDFEDEIVHRRSRRLSGNAFCKVALSEESVFTSNQADNTLKASQKRSAPVLGITSLHRKKRKEKDDDGQECATELISPVHEQSLSSLPHQREIIYGSETCLKDPIPNTSVHTSAQEKCNLSLSTQTLENKEIQLLNNNLTQMPDLVSTHSIVNKQKSSPSDSPRERIDVSQGSQSSSCTNVSQHSSHMVQEICKILLPPSANTPSINLTQNASSEHHTTPKKKVDASDSGCTSNSNSSAICEKLTRSDVTSVNSEKSYQPGGMIRKIMCTLEKRQNKKSKSKNIWLSVKKEEEIAENLIRRLLDGKSNINVLQSVVKEFGKMNSPSAAKSVGKIIQKYVEEDTTHPQTFPPSTHKPNLNVSQQQLVALLYNLEYRYRQFTLLHKTVLSGIEYTIFKPGYGLKIELLVSLTRFYAALCLLKHDKRQLQVFCYDALYCYSHNVYAVMLTVFSIFPEFFPRADQLPGIKENLLLKCMVYEVGKALPVKDNYKYSKSFLFDKKSLMEVLQKKYGYKNEHTRDSYLSLLMDTLKRSDQCESKDLEPSFIIFGKRMEWYDSYKYIICQHFFPLLNSWRRKQVSDVIIERVVRLIGLIARCYPVISAKASILEIINKLRDILLEDENVSIKVQEAAVISLIRLSRNEYDKVAHILAYWERTDYVSQDVMDAVTTFAAHRSKSYWNSLIVSKNV